MCVLQEPWVQIPNHQSKPPTSRYLINSMENEQVDSNLEHLALSALFVNSKLMFRDCKKLNVLLLP